LKLSKKEVIIMDYGVDLHNSFFKIAYYNPDGNLNFKRFNTDEKGIEQFKSMLTPECRVAVEAGVKSFWFYDQLIPTGCEVKIVDVKRFKIIYLSGKKTDKEDASKLLKYLRLNELPEIWVPPTQVRELRSLFRSHIGIQQSKVKIKNMVHGLVKQEGLKLKKRSVHKGNKEFERVKAKLKGCVSRQVDRLMDILEEMEKAAKDIKKEILYRGRIFRNEIKILMSIRGIDAYTAIGVMADIGDIKRFASAKKYSSYVGVVSKIDESGKYKRQGSITKAGRKLSRYLLTEAIFHIIKANEGLKSWYERKVKSRGIGKAKIGLVRKLTVIIYWMLTRGEKFRGYAKKMVIEKMMRYKRELERYINEKEIQMKFEIRDWLVDWEESIEEERAELRIERQVNAD
jgi:transposase